MPVGDTPPGLRVVRDREAKERSLPRPGDGTLCALTCNLRRPSMKRVKFSMTRWPAFAADIDVAAIRSTCPLTMMNRATLEHQAQR
jgi:hypothetical protein